MPELATLLLNVFLPGRPESGLQNLRASRTNVQRNREGTFEMKFDSRIRLISIIRFSVILKGSVDQITKLIGC